MKLIIAPDSFKDCCSATYLTQVMALAALEIIPEAEIISLPMADGGEGFVEALVQSVGGIIKSVGVTGHLGEFVSASFGIFKESKTAVMEMACASGLPLVPLNKRNPLKTTTYGTGEMIKAALEEGCTTIILGIGGSATVDGGMGMAQALGAKFFDQEGQLLGLGGEYLKQINSIDLSQLDFRIKSTDIQVACDVINPLCGKIGAAFVYGPQKGATDEMVGVLDEGLENFAQRVFETTGKKVRDIPGAGAAGGLGAGTVAFLNAQLRSGFEVISTAVGLKGHLATADLIITGEGKTDSQTFNGKVPFGVGRLAREFGVPVICISGSIGEGAEDLYHEGITALFSIVDKPMELKEAIEQAPYLIAKTVKNVLRIWMSAFLKK